MIQEKRAQSARSRKYYDDYQVRMRSKMLKRRTKEEMVRIEKHSLFSIVMIFFGQDKFFCFKVLNCYQSSFCILDFPQTVQRWLRHSEGSSARAEEIREGAEGHSSQYSAKRDRVHGELVSLSHLFFFVLYTCHCSLQNMCICVWQTDYRFSCEILNRDYHLNYVHDVTNWFMLYIGLHV